MAKAFYLSLFVRFYSAFRLISPHEWAMRASGHVALLVSAFAAPPLFWLLRTLGLGVSFTPVYFTVLIPLAIFNFIHFDLDDDIDAKVTLAAEESYESLGSKLFTFLLLPLSLSVFFFMDKF